MTGRVTVVGAGVIGLSCAVRLAEAGLEVDVLARDLPLETTSSVAGALWLPYLSGPADDVARWGRITFDALTELADEPRAGVERRAGFLLHRSAPASPPTWAAALAPAVELVGVTDPAPGYGFGWQLTAPVLDMPRYLRFLTERLARAGGTLTRLPLPALPTRGLVVNCTGVAARSLASDPAVHPVRGQVVIVGDPGVPHFFSDADGPQSAATYVIPRGGQVVLGGTADRDDWSTTPDPVVAARILERARTLVPELAGARVLAHRVGLRPARPDVRLDVVEPAAGHAIVHCYGHGGSGVTLSWGCAADVTAAVLELVG